MNQQFDILVIDDEQVILDAVQRICAVEKLNTDTANDANIALQKLKKNNYNLIVCDIMLPEMDGFQFLSELENVNNNIPVIMTTGFSTVENAVRSLSEGAIDFLPKPFTADELCSSIHRGMKFVGIKNKIIEQKNLIDSESVIFVPCPSKFYRLGYNSWFAKENDGTALIGVTDLFLKTSGTASIIELQKVDEEIIQGFSCAKIESEDGLEHLIISPITGRIIEKNENVESDVSIVEKSPYFEGWLYKLIPSNLTHEMTQLTPCTTETF